MLSCGNLAVLLTLMVMALSRCGSAAEKLATCCTSVTKDKIKEPIVDFLVQRSNPPCVRAIIFQTETGLYCSQVNAPWVRRKIEAFRKANQNQVRAQIAVPSPTPKSKVSLLSIITSTADPSSYTSATSTTSASASDQTSYSSTAFTPFSSSPTAADH